MTRHCWFWGRAPTWLFLCGLALVACGGPGNGIAHFDGDCAGLDGPAALVGMDATSGERLWERTVGDAYQVVVADGSAVGIGYSGASFGVATATGEILWCADLGRMGTEGNMVSPGFAAAGPVVASVVASGDIVGLDPRSGEQLWVATVGQVEGAHIEEVDGIFYVYGAEESERPWLFALDPLTGEQIEQPPGPVPQQQMGAYSMDVTVFETGRQERKVSITSGGQELWSALLPGFVFTLQDDALIVIDQTDGTGVVAPSGVHTTVVAYELDSGEVRWSVPLPQTPSKAVEVGELVVVPVGPELHAIDRTTGQIVWTADHGSPGRGGSYSGYGQYQWLAAPDDVLVGLIVAEQPYRD